VLEASRPLGELTGDAVAAIDYIRDGAETAVLVCLNRDGS
jgi:hypothetical protein